jgi:hypothetical protein
MKSARNFVKENKNKSSNVQTKADLLKQAKVKKKEKHRQLMAQSRNSTPNSKKAVKKEKVEHITPTRSTSEDMSPNLETIKQQPLTKKNLSRLQNLFSFGELEKNNSEIQKLDNFEGGALPDLEKGIEQSIYNTYHNEEKMKKIYQYNTDADEKKIFEQSRADDYEEEMELLKKFERTRADDDEKEMKEFDRNEKYTLLSVIEEDEREYEVF